MSNSKKILRIVPTKRNKDLEPLPTKGGIIGYDEEIHDEDSLEFTYKLPLGAIKRLIRSYYKDIQMYDEENVYLATSSSSGLRGKPYCYRMLSDISKQLDKYGLNGKKIDDEVFDRYFKSDYEKMKKYSKNHSNQGINDPFEPCNDLDCRNYSSSLLLKLKLLRQLFRETVRQIWEILVSRLLIVDTKVRVTLNLRS